MPNLSSPIVCTGNLVMDMVFSVNEFPEGGIKVLANDMHITFGGCAANAALAINTLGGASRLAARVGDDELGDAITAQLTAVGVDCSYVVRCADCRSSCSAVALDSSGDRQLVNYLDPNLPSDPAVISAALDAPFAATLADTRWPQATVALMQAARAAKVPGVVDVETPADIETLADASHLAFSEQGLFGFTDCDDVEKALNKVADTTGAFVCVTLGPDGVRYLLDGKLRHQPGYAIDAVDTLAAGDVWHGAFALGLARGIEVEDALDYANAAAALKCTRTRNWQEALDEDKVGKLMAHKV